MGSLSTTITTFVLRLSAQLKASPIQTNVNLIPTSMQSHIRLTKSAFIININQYSKQTINLRTATFLSEDVGFPSNKTIKEHGTVSNMNEKRSLQRDFPKLLCRTGQNFPHITSRNSFHCFLSFTSPQRKLFRSTQSQIFGPLTFLFSSFIYLKQTME